MWANSGTPDDALVTRPAQVTVKDLAFQEPVWVDLITGRVYELPADRMVLTMVRPSTLGSIRSTTTTS